MNKPLRKIGILLVLLITLPVMIFLSYELNSLSGDEEIITDIYNNQLESILYSINQYSDDLLSNWANKIEEIYGDESNCKSSNFTGMIGNFFEFSQPVNGIFVYDYLNRELVCIESRTEDSAEKDKISYLIDANSDKIKRLFTYKRGGYRKLEPLEFESENNERILVFILGETESEYKICGFIIDPEVFIRVALRQKIQSISRDEVIIGIKAAANDSLIFSTDQISAAGLEQTKSIWVLPDYLLGIALKGESIESIAKQRIFLNIILISIVSFVILVGSLLTFRAIKNEVELAQIKSDFVSNVSHELRTPLALISMYAETLELDRIKSAEKKKEYYKVISSETSRLSKIVNGILNFSKMEAGKRKFHFEILDLNSVVEEVLDTYGFHLKNEGFKLFYQPSDKSLYANLDSEALSEALINLIENSIKYSGDSKAIELKTGEDKDFVFVSVTDFGIGISGGDKKKIFDKFYRVSSGLVHDTKGTGLGLALVSQIVKAHKGEIDLISELGKGSTFTLKFPAETLKIRDREA